MSETVDDSESERLLRSSTDALAAIRAELDSLDAAIARLALWSEIVYAESAIRCGVTALALPVPTLTVKMSLPPHLASLPVGCGISASVIIVVEPLEHTGSVWAQTAAYPLGQCSAPDQCWTAEFALDFRVTDLPATVTITVHATLMEESLTHCIRCHSSEPVLDILHFAIPSTEALAKNSPANRHRFNDIATSILGIPVAPPDAAFLCRTNGCLAISVRPELHEFTVPLLLACDSGCSMFQVFLPCSILPDSVTNRFSVKRSSAPTKRVAFAPDAYTLVLEISADHPSVYYAVKGALLRRYLLYAPNTGNGTRMPLDADELEWWQALLDQKPKDQQHTNGGTGSTLQLRTSCELADVIEYRIFPISLPSGSVLDNPELLFPNSP